MDLPGIYHVREITSKDFDKPDTISFPIKQLKYELVSEKQLTPWAKMLNVKV